MMTYFNQQEKVEELLGLYKEKSCILVSAMNNYHPIDYEKYVYIKDEIQNKEKELGGIGMTAHKKLLAIGYEEKIHDTAVKNDVESGIYKQYVNYPKVILIDIEAREFTMYTLYNDSKGVDDVAWVDEELLGILTQYFEELEELK